MNVGSLFAGVGGFDLAAERAGMTVAWQSEVDEFASAVLEDHWPEVPNHGDIHNVRIPVGSGSRRRDAGHPERTITDPPDRDRSGDLSGSRTDGIRAAAAVDVLAGGFPCQDYSVAGSRGGLAGDRGALWWEFHRLIAEGHPRWIVGENVPGLISSRSGQDFGTIIDSITDLGYRVAWRVLDAQHFGVAQRRRRVFIVGCSGAGSPSQVLALAEGLSGHPRPSRPEGPEPASGARGSSAGSGLIAETGIVRTLTARYGASAPDLTDAEGGHLIPEPMAFNIYPASGQGADLEAKPTERAMTLTALAGQGHDRGTRIVGSGVRRLTPLECERLQGFPDGWTASQNDTQRYRQMGNAVAVPVVEWIMRRIAEQP